MMFVLALMPGLPLLPFALLGGVMGFVGYSLPRRRAAEQRKEEARARAEAEQAALEQLKEENPEAYAKRERPSEEDEEGAEGEAAEGGEKPTSSED
jgi:flagellar biosynthesis component FlhA